MSDFLQRRSFLGRLTAALGAIAIARPAVVSATAPHSSVDWLKNLKGKHRQVFDNVSMNDGAALSYTSAFLGTVQEGYGIPESEAGAVVIVRHNAVVNAFNDFIWEKYKLGELVSVTDKATGKPAVRNLYARKTEGVTRPNASIEELVARGVIFGACNLAASNRATARAPIAGVSVEEAKKEWAANLLPGVTLIPSGVWGVNHAQENGCTYCSAG